jgi:hypothetical protein
MPRYSRICWPKNANTTITANDTATACQAARLLDAADRPRVRDRKSGIVPTGSMITNNVTKTSVSRLRVPVMARSWPSRPSRPS